MDQLPIQLFCETFGAKIKTIVHSKDWAERDTLLAAFDVVQPSDLLLYMHTKGITRMDLEGLYVDDWRRVMNYFLITKHEHSIQLLTGNDPVDTVGVNYEEAPAPHFSGNFWWVRGDYFLSLPRHIGLDKYDPEVHFLFKKNPKYKCVHHTKTHHYRSFYPPSRYIDLTDSETCT
jgi:hypothetical protein